MSRCIVKKLPTCVREQADVSIKSVRKGEAFEASNYVKWKEEMYDVLVKVTYLVPLLLMYLCSKHFTSLQLLKLFLGYLPISVPVYTITYENVAIWNHLRKKGPKKYKNKGRKMKVK